MSVKLYFHQVSECNSQKHEGLASSWPQIDRGWQEMKGRSKLQKMKLIFFNMELIKFSQTLWVQRQSENWTLEIRIHSQWVSCIQRHLNTVQKLSGLWLICVQFLSSNSKTGKLHRIFEWQTRQPCLIFRSWLRTEYSGDMNVTPLPVFPV